MNASQIKKSLINEITQLNDFGSLHKIQDFIIALNRKKQKTEANTALFNNRSISHNDRENFNDYIKEWLSEMK
ncbi:MAG: hypothetical protein U5K51_17445 [Flavobacteriaceae bacterium]|nr:hypothetical protein [Flavobacteriaceae bacterium]